MLMMRVRGRALRVVSKLMLLAMLVAALTVALVPVALADGHLQAADGQSLNDQPPDVQALYRSTYGAGAAARWVEDHNAAIGEMVMAPMPAMTDLYLTVRHVAWQRSGDAELAARIAADVMARGTAEAFLAGTDTGVVWGVWTEPEPMGMGSRGNGGSSSSTSSGPSTPTSPSTSMVSGWGDVTRNWVVGEKVTLTLPRSTDANAKTYVHTTTTGELDALGLMISDDGRTVSGTTLLGDYVGTYRAHDASGPLGSPYELTLTINVRDADLQPDFRTRSQPPIIVIGRVAIPDSTVLPMVYGGNLDVTYKISGAPKGLSVDPTTRLLSGTPAADAAFKTYTVTYTATDQDGDTASLTFTITVEEEVDPVAPSIDNMQFVGGTAIDGRFLPAGSGGNGLLTYVITDDDLPPGLAFNTKTLYLDGVPTAPTVDAATTYEVTYTVTDEGGSGESDSTTFEIRITKP